MQQPLLWAKNRLVRTMPPHTDLHKAQQKAVLETGRLFSLGGVYEAKCGVKSDVHPKDC